MTSAALAAYRGEGEGEVLRRLLNHVSQRFRLNYVLGNGPNEVIEDEEEYDEEDDYPEPEVQITAPAVQFDSTRTNALLGKAVVQLQEIARSEAQRLRADLGAAEGNERDERVLEEIFEENLDDLLRESEEFQSLADSLMDEVERRFELLAPGTSEYTKQGWPRLWKWETQDRSAFLNVLRRFTSNHSRYFGTLLSPLVNGVRIGGPFQPTWMGERPRLVILDGEGLGHTPDSSASIPTALTRRFDEVDAVLLVDNAAQPMQAAPVVVMRSLAAAGKASKLLLCFTHMDLVKGDNIRSYESRKQHVLASAENVLTAIGQELGPFAERGLRQRLRTGHFFVGDIQRALETNAKRDSRSIDQLVQLIDAVTMIRETPEVVPARPEYDRVNLVLAIKNAAERFQEEWDVILGRRTKPGVSKAHWAKVKALSRRLAEGWADQYDTLMPVADLYRDLQTDIFVFIQNPLRWSDGKLPSDDQKQAVFAQFANVISAKVVDLAKRRVRDERVQQWQDAYSRRGTWSTFFRAAVIKGEIYEHAAPVPDAAPSRDRNEFLHEVIRLVSEAAAELEIILP